MDRMRDVIKSGLREGLRAFSPQDRLSMAWIAACGPVLAERGSVVGYDNGVVKVEVSDGAWLEEMKSISGHLETELARIAGVEVTKLHFKVKRNES